MKKNQARNLPHNELITDRSGNPYQYLHYTAWGESFAQAEATQGSFSSSYRFNAKELDQETGNYYYGARYYHPKWSVWLSVDPLGESPNQTPYHFVSNNPVMRIDPNGLKDFVDASGEVLGNDGTKDYGKILVEDKLLMTEIRTATAAGKHYTIRDKDSQQFFEVPSIEEVAEIESALLPKLVALESDIAFGANDEGKVRVSKVIEGDNVSVNLGLAHADNYNEGYERALFDGHLHPIGDDPSPSIDKDLAIRLQREKPEGLGLSRPSFVLRQINTYAKPWIEFYNGKGVVWSGRFSQLKKLSDKVHTQ